MDVSPQKKVQRVSFSTLPHQPNAFSFVDLNNYDEEELGIIDAGDEEWLDAFEALGEHSAVTIFKHGNGTWYVSREHPHFVRPLHGGQRHSPNFPICWPSSSSQQLCMAGASDGIDEDELGIYDAGDDEWWEANDAIKEHSAVSIFNHRDGTWYVSREHPQFVRPLHGGHRHIRAQTTSLYNIQSPLNQGLDTDEEQLGIVDAGDDDCSEAFDAIRHHSGVTIFNHRDGTWYVSKENPNVVRPLHGRRRQSQRYGMNWSNTFPWHPQQQGNDNSDNESELGIHDDGDEEWFEAFEAIRERSAVTIFNHRDGTWYVSRDHPEFVRPLHGGHRHHQGQFSPLWDTHTYHPIRSYGSTFCPRLQVFDDPLFVSQSSNCWKSDEAGICEQSVVDAVVCSNKQRPHSAPVSNRRDRPKSASASPESGARAAAVGSNASTASPVKWAAETYQGANKISATQASKQTAFCKRFGFFCPPRGSNSPDHSFARDSDPTQGLPVSSPSASELDIPEDDGSSLHSSCGSLYR